MKLPAQPFGAWFQEKGWRPHAHQLALLERDPERPHDLVIAPTGGGKTLAGFLPSLLALSDGKHKGLHTLYISPLKALAVDVARNLQIPIQEMALPIETDTRTGDTPNHRRQAQRKNPPQILMTTPESLALLLSYADAPRVFKTVRTVIIDEAHAMASNKRGQQLALGLARLQSLSPDVRRIALSATVAKPAELAAWVSSDGKPDLVRIIDAGRGAKPRVSVLSVKKAPPWSGHSGRYAMPAVMKQIEKSGTSLLFVNTRSQAEFVFQALWRLNDNNLPIALHHGSLSKLQRQKVEAAMAAGSLRAVVATSSLDLGVDWAAVDLVIQIGAPKGVSRMVQRIGRANHRLDKPSRALFVPTNRFEVLECRAAVDAINDGVLDGDAIRTGGLDVLAQHIMLMACAGPFRADALYEEVRQAGPYRSLSRAQFDQVLAFVVDGGYALQGYEQWRRLQQPEPGLYRLRSPGLARRLRMNVGTIVEAESLKVKKRRGPVVGEVEEHFIQSLSPGDTFVLGGQVWRYERLKDMAAEVTAAVGKDPKVPAYAGGKFPLNTALAERVRAIFEKPEAWSALPKATREWLELQREKSELPRNDDLLVETFPRGGKWFLVTYSFAGRNAHQTLGMLLTRRMEALGQAPLGFVANDYALACWSLKPVEDPAVLFDPQDLSNGMEEWLASSALLKRTFRQAAVIGGLIERRFPGKQKTGRQVTFSSDIIYDTLRKYEPDHVLLQATRADAMVGLVDFGRIEELLTRIQGRVRHVRRERITPLAVPLMLEIGREPVYGGTAEDLLLQSSAEELLKDVMGDDKTAAA